MNPSDARTVEVQLGRPPRGRWGVLTRCAAGAPTLIAVEPRLEDGTPFPTYFWLTCPLAASLLHELETAGIQARWSELALVDEGLAEKFRRAAAEYRRVRAESVADGVDPCAGGIAGERDPLRVKCLHARVAAAMGGIDDPVGRALLPEIEGAMARCDRACCVTPGDEDAVSSV